MWPRSIPHSLDVAGLVVRRSDQVIGLWEGRARRFASAPTTYRTGCARGQDVVAERVIVVGLLAPLHGGHLQPPEVVIDKRVAADELDVPRSIVEIGAAR